MRTSLFSVAVIGALAVLLAGESANAARPKAPPKPKVEAPIVPPKEGKSETISLFDGKTLDGWEGNPKLWKVESGEIVCNSEQPLALSSYLTTKRKFSDFRLLATVKKSVGEMHSGIGFWGAAEPHDAEQYAYAGKLVMFPSNWGMYELFGRKNLHVENREAKKVGKQHDWNQLEILAQGNRVRVAVNGVLTFDWRDPQPETIKEGPIALQMPDSPDLSEVRFKELVLTTFPEDKLTTVKE